MNRHRFNANMEAAWELRPGTDETPCSCGHNNRFQQAKKAEKPSETKKTRENGR